MNKNTISWTHYIYATITASVLAYVTVMDTSKESDDSATNMLPNIDNSSNNNVDDEEEEEYEEPSAPEEEEEAEPSAPEEESTTQEPSIPIAEPVESEQKPLFGSSRRKLKKNNTKTSKKNSKNTKTHRRH